MRGAHDVVDIFSGRSRTMDDTETAKEDSVNQTANNGPQKRQLLAA